MTLVWIILGLILGVSVYWFITNKRGFHFRWYEWVLVALSVLLVMFTVQNYAASRVELESRAATYLTLMFGIPGVLFGVIPVLTCWNRNRKHADVAPA